MCLYPRLIKNRKYTKTKKNGGKVPPVYDKRVLQVPVGCGKCMECLKQKGREWTVRLLEEFRNNPKAKFVTFSFSDKSLIKLEEHLKIKVATGIRKTITDKNGKVRNYYTYEHIKNSNELYGYDLDNELATKGTRLFLERWRKKYGKSCKHWFITELGTKHTERIHIHGILFTDVDNKTIEKIWQYGNTWIGKYVNEGTIKYIVKYLSKTDIKHKEYKPKILTSAGIGNNYLNRKDSKNNKFKGKDTKEYYVTRSGHKLALPIYYRNKIYSDDEKEKLWLYKLDEQVRWVNGVKIDISNGEDGYYNWLELARNKNKELGYGNNKINWSRRNYENERRNLIKMERYAKEFSRGKKR